MLITLVAWGALAMFSPVIADYPSSPQWRDGRFHNPRPPGPGDMPESTLCVWWDVFVNKPGGTVPGAPLPVRPLTRADLDAAPDRSLYRLGHSTLLMKLRGQWWLTDPVFVERASPLQFVGPKRFHAPPIALDELPPLRAVILSHDHYDHLDPAAIRALDSRAQAFLVPLGVGDRLAGWGIARDKIRQFDWWQGAEVDGLKLTAAPAQHFSGRSFSDANRTLWALWVIEDDAFRLFFSGDSGYFGGFAEIGERFGPFDLALHAWQDPFEQVLRTATERGVPVATPMFGERVDMNAPREGRRWWRGGLQRLD